MQYLGGKSRLAKKIVAILENLRTPGQVYLEPFIGGGSVFSLMSDPKIGSDLHEDLILL
jgi:site-specific DNA-adenine methylase